MIAPVIGVAWYERHDYSALLNELLDADRFPQTYDLWLAQVSGHMQQMRCEGYQVILVPVKLPEFLHFCHQRKVSVNCCAHRLFLAEKLSSILERDGSRRAPYAVPPAQSDYRHAMEVIDDLFGSGYAARDPDLVSAYLATRGPETTSPDTDLPWVSRYPRSGLSHP